MSSDSAKYARLARKAGRLSKFRGTMHARHKRVALQHAGCEAEHHRILMRMQSIIDDYHTLDAWIRNIQDEMALIVARG